MSQTKVVYFYSRDDESYIEHSHLIGLAQEDGVEVINGTEVYLGDETEKETAELIESADITILFYSPIFYASPFYETYIEKMLEKHEAYQTEIVIVYLRAYEHSKKASDYKLDFFPSKDIPLKRNPNDPADELWKQLIVKIKSFLPDNDHDDLVLNNKYKFLVNLCNRRAQTRQLRTALREQAQKMANEGPLTPLICLIHGSPDENLDEYRKRLSEHDLLSLLNLNPDKFDKISHYSIQWARDAYDLADFQNYLRESLAEALLGDYDAKIENISRKLADHKNPVMISYRLDTADWKKRQFKEKQKQPPDFIEDFLTFWNKLPPVASSNVVVVCLFFTYKMVGNPEMTEEFKRRNLEAEAFFSPPGSPAQKKAGFPQFDFRPSESWFSRMNETGEINESEEKFKNIIGIVLDKLSDVPFHDVENWAQKDTHYDNFCNHHGKIFFENIVLKRIERYFDDPRLPMIDDYPVMQMKDLTNKLISLLKKHECNRR